MQTEYPYILLADDDPEDRQDFIDEFNDQNPGIAVTNMQSGRELLSYLSECLPDRLPTVIVLDYQIPDLNGPQILSHLGANERYKQIVKVIWSTSRRTKDIEECKRLGATDYIFKPDSIDELKHAIHVVTTIFETAARTTH